MSESPMTKLWEGSKYTLYYAKTRRFIEPGLVLWNGEKHIRLVRFPKLAYYSPLDKLRYKIARFRYQWKDKLFADLATRATNRFPTVAYWIAINVGAQNIHDDEVGPEVFLMDVLERQFVKTRSFSYE